MLGLTPAAALILALGGPRASCPVDQHCLRWAFDYLGDCVCNFREGVSLALGLASVFCWAVAEVPQIVTNFLAGSTEGVSLTFLLTWTIGDVFNLAGCFLEPATLPTQMYMAVMYTITTVILVLQSVYYEMVVPHRKTVHVLDTDASVSAGADTFTQPLLAPPGPGFLGAPGAGASAAVAVPTSTSAATGLAPHAASEIISVPLSRKTSSRNIHISSARSLASSHTPSMGSFMPGSVHGPHGHGHTQGAHVGSLLSQSPGQGFPHISMRPQWASPASPSAHPGAQPPLGQPGNSRSTSSPARAVLGLGAFLFLVCAGAHFPGLPQAGLGRGVDGTPQQQGVWPSRIGRGSVGETDAGQWGSWGLWRLHSLRSTWAMASQPYPHPVGAALKALWHLGGAARSKDIDQSSSAGSNAGIVRGFRPLLYAVPDSAPRRGLLPVHPASIIPDEGQGAAQDGDDDSGSGVGELLGWLMAAIYMGGRVPQIYLNIQRGTVEGLSPLMFLFALLGNVTYVGSILVRSTAWEDLRPNLPWIVDAGVCVLLDLFILGQFVYYSLKEPSTDMDFVDTMDEGK